MTENLSTKDKAAFYALLAKHNAKPSPGGEEWARCNWFNLENIIDRVCSLQHETKFKLGKNKTILCSVLGACLSAAVESRFKRRSEEKAIIDSLQNLVEILQKQLNEERNEIYALRAALREERVKNSDNVDSSMETEEKETPHIKQIYPHKELEAVKNCGEMCCPHLRPLVKTEYNYINDEDFEPHITTKHIPYSATELAKLKKEYSHLPQESETEYIFQVSLTGGDQIKSTEHEASGYRGHGVFLTTGNKRISWSLTQFVAYWAEGLSPLERGEPLAIIGGPDQLLENIHKAACLQMIHERKLISGYESPKQLPVKPELMTPLIRGLPEPLKPTAITLQKTIMALGPVERLDRFLGIPSNQTGSTDPGFAPYSIPSQLPASQSDSSAGGHKVWTGNQLAADLINYSEKYGPVKTPEDTSTRLSQGYKHSLTLAQDAQELENIPIAHNVAVYQYIDDILVGGDEIEVGDVQQKIISHLESLNLQVTSMKIQKPSQEVKLLGIWWKGAMTCFPPDTLNSLDQIKMPESRKDLQQALGLLVFWRKHIPDFSIIARPLYGLLRKGVKWDWIPSQEEAMHLLIFEVTAHQALGHIHPTDPFQVEWGFASSGLSVHIWQHGPEGLMISAGFYSCDFQDAEKGYTTWEKGLFVVSLALKEVEKVGQQQPVVLRGPFEVIKTITTGIPPPDGVAQGASVRKWYAQIEHYCNIFSITEEAVKGVNDKWVVNGCHKITAFCPTPPSIIPSPQGPDDPKHPAHDPGQPALVDLLTIGAVPLVLKIPLNDYACIVFDALGKEHQKNYMLDNSIILIFCLLVADFVVFAFHRRTPRDIKDHLNHDKTSDTFLYPSTTPWPELFGMALVPSFCSLYRIHGKCGKFKPVNSCYA
ncbi:hypothetical protein DUI87_19769 [Hirundo rustica rustica]|uniref:Reverse transcriptase/retrotransposon-derived protein RNase H-like domain-containing protein n=1 Tax=Hirundo rustica rustica TaxID=333673 RepID=A0A3M0JWS2_HIRRU|nr:hypothetical protein DUI87_19769 [Hirundo rustica rustica]